MEKQKEDLKYRKRRIIIQLITIIVVVLLLVFLTIKLWPHITKLGDEEYRQIVSEKLKNFGVLGILVLILISMLQVILAIIPGEPIELISGIMYGPIGGLVICLIGVTLGAILVYYLVKGLGRGFAKSFVNIEDGKKLGIFTDARRAEVIIFSVLLIPAIPKDFIAFVIPFTKIKLRRFLVINAIARIPSIISSTIIGSSIISGNLWLGTAIMIVSLITALLGLIFNKQIVAKLNKKKSKDETE